MRSYWLCFHRLQPRDLSDLVERGILLLRGAGRGAYYMLGPGSV